MQEPNMQEKRDEEQRQLNNRRQLYCLHVINRIIQRPLTDMRRLVACYERREKAWRKYDEEHGFDFEKFQNENKGMLQTLQFIVDEMESSSDVEVQEKSETLAGKMLLDGALEKSDGF